MMFFHSSQLLYGDELRARREALRAVLSAVVHEGGSSIINRTGVATVSAGWKGRQRALAWLRREDEDRADYLNLFMLASRRWISGSVLWLPKRHSGHSLILLMHIDQGHH
jgi:hypothetical protein